MLAWVSKDDSTEVSLTAFAVGCSTRGTHREAEGCTGQLHSKISQWSTCPFLCGARKCKVPLGGVYRYQDSTNNSSTTNLKHHATSCWGQE
ncbi:hypothetical protein PAXINDRAFT_103471, partial [Paxillus involutus ATCC 200175]